MEPQPQLSLKAAGKSRRRLLVNRVAEAAAIAAAALAIARARDPRLVGLQPWRQRAQLGLLHERPGALRRVRRRHRSRDRRHAPPRRDRRRCSRCRPACSTAIYVSEFASASIGRQVRLWLDVLNGFPSIVIGIFVFTLVVKVKLPLLGIGHHQSAIAGGFALSIIMLPLVARATMEVLPLVPNDLREASYALGVSKWQTVLRASCCRPRSAASSPVRRSRSLARQARRRRSSSPARSRETSSTGTRPTRCCRSRS